MDRVEAQPSDIRCDLEPGQDPVPGAQPAAVPPHPAITFRQRDWVLLLKHFSSRNVGREASVEVHDADLGAQVIAAGYLLQGVAYDWHDERVEIMLGEPGSTEHHITHSVGAVAGLDILRRGEHDEVLCIGQRGGRTLLLLH